MTLCPPAAGLTSLPEADSEQRNRPDIPERDRIITPYDAGVFEELRQQSLVDRRPDLSDGFHNDFAISGFLQPASIFPRTTKVAS